VRCISHTLQGGTTAVNAAGGTLMVDQGGCFDLTVLLQSNIVNVVIFLIIERI